MLISISSLDIIDIFISAQGILEPKDKTAVILATNNEEYIRKCIENEELYLGEHGKVDLILKLNNLEAVKGYIESEELLNDVDKVDLMLSFGDEAYVKDCLANPTLNILPTQRARAIINGIKDEAYRRNCLTDDTFAIDLAAKEMLVNAIGSEEDKEKWNRRIVKVKDISQLSLEELMALPEDAIIKTEDDIYQYYKKDEYVQVRKKMNEILEGIETPIPGDEDTELRAFLEVSKRLAMHISYDKFATSKVGEKDYKLQKECRNLYGGLMNGECVCAGYACILKNALACLGIEAKYINGADPNSTSAHAWNQVKIGGKWYNTDLTWERDKIVRTGIASKDMLKSDKEFENHKGYSENRTSTEEVCLESMRDREDSKNKTNKSLINKKEQEKTEI